jgi:FkbM family methyltransferase
VGALRVVEIPVGALQYKLALLPDDDLSRSIEQLGQPYELDLLETMASFVAPGDLVVDIGANVGNHTAYLAVVCRAVVHAYEPHPETAAALEATVSANELLDRVHVHRVALGATRAWGSIVSPPGRLSESRIEEGSGDVPIERLDDQGLAGVRMIKVDVEGAQAAVLEGGMGLIGSDRPIIAVEAEFPAERRDVDSILEPFGYLRLPVRFAATPSYVYVPRRLDLARSLLRGPVLRRAAHNLLIRGRLP